MKGLNDDFLHIVETFDDFILWELRHHVHSQFVELVLSAFLLVVCIGVLLDCHVCQVGLQVIQIELLVASMGESSETRPIEIDC